MGTIKLAELKFDSDVKLTGLFLNRVDNLEALVKRKFLVLIAYEY